MATKDWYFPSDLLLPCLIFSIRFVSTFPEAMLCYVILSSFAMLHIIVVSAEGNANGYCVRRDREISFDYNLMNNPC
jgi:hypothetical protein